MTYLMPAALFVFMLSTVFFILVFPKEKDERYQMIVLHAFKNAYYVLMVALLVLFLFSKWPSFEVLNEYFKEAILVVLLVSHVTFTLTAIILNRRM